jgi:hypothetical protein
LAWRGRRSRIWGQGGRRPTLQRQRESGICRGSNDRDEIMRRPPGKSYLRLARTLGGKLDRVGGAEDPEPGRPPIGQRQRESGVCRGSKDRDEISERFAGKSFLRTAQTLGGKLNWLGVAAAPESWPRWEAAQTPVRRQRDSGNAAPAMIGTRSWGFLLVNDSS